MPCMRAHRVAYAGAQVAAQKLKKSLQPSKPRRLAASVPQQEPVNDKATEALLQFRDAEHAVWPSRESDQSFEQRLLLAACRCKELDKIELVLEGIRSGAARKIAEPRMEPASRPAQPSRTNPTVPLATFLLESDPPLGPVVELLIRSSAAYVNEPVDLYPAGSPAWRLMPLHAAVLSGQDDVVQVRCAV